MSTNDQMIQVVSYNLMWYPPIDRNSVLLNKVFYLVYFDHPLFTIRSEFRLKSLESPQEQLLVSLLNMRIPVHLSSRISLDLFSWQSNFVPSSHVGKMSILGVSGSRNRLFNFSWFKFSTVSSSDMILSVLP